MLLKYGTKVISNHPTLPDFEGVIVGIGDYLAPNGQVYLVDFGRPIQDIRSLEPYHVIPVMENWLKFESKSENQPESNIVEDNGKPDKSDYI